MKEKKTGLVLEGGGMRGIYTAGVLDVFMENGITFDGVIGVSAGAIHGCSFVSGQKGRSIRYYMKYCRNWHFMSFRSLFLTGNIAEEKFCYHTLPEKLDPYDYEAFKKSHTKFYVGGSHVLHINIITGMLLERLMQKTDQYHLQWSDQFLITTASALHDIGKIGIDEKILNKPGKLTKEEFEIMKTHTLIGASMLKSIEMYQNEKLLQVAYQICRWHHERYDGKGYPDGLKGEEIPISAQVVAIADVYDALVGKRVYKKAFSHETAIHMILNGECGAFNPLLLECLTDIQNRLKEETKSGFNKKENEEFFPNLSEEIKEETKK